MTEKNNEKKVNESQINEDIQAEKEETKNEETKTAEVKNETLEDNSKSVSDEKETVKDEEKKSACGTDEAASLKEELDDMKLKFNKFKDENTKLNNEIETIKERLLRTTAEYENYRNRTKKEKEGIYTDSCIDVLKNILPVLDNMERAQSTDGNFDDLKRGIDMTIRQFKDSLEKLGVEEIDASGEFDPNLHNAVMHVQDDSYGEGAIVEVLQKGYKKNDKVIRYSMVRVAN
ncbi:MAG: nucleotide exchange factor GrpE [Clostridium sp.]|nr:nucleotide exchange factor GrpE [Clostridium sp.]